MNKLSFKEIQILLDEKHDKYNRIDFIQNDPIVVPHQFTKKEDIEISGFLISTIALGQRKTIISNGKKLVKMMDYTPYEFIINFKENELKPFLKFKHRTFSGEDCICFMKSLQNIYKNHIGMEEVFYRNMKLFGNMKKTITEFRNIFISSKGFLKRTFKHIANPMQNASAKRLNMFLRWMIRKDKRGVDFGLWGKMKPNQLYCPLDVHTGNTARSLGILKRKSNDWNAVEELTNFLIKLDKDDPVKYDFALFGMSAFEKF